MSQAAPLLSVRNLRTWLDAGSGVVRAVDGVSFDVHRGETFALVGESGCGKSMTALSIMRLLPEAGGIVGGTVELDGRDLLQLPESAMREVRGGRIGMIFQEPALSLNPVMTAGAQIAETLRRHTDLTGAALEARVLEVIEAVRMPDAARRRYEYPFQLSGGMKQRVMIAMALACDPELLIADEPTTALDVTIQAQILELLRTLRTELDTAIILITHDLGVIAELADEVIVMYAGKVVERCAAERLFSEPQHPYTVGLLGSIPRLHLQQERLSAIEGIVPDPAAFPEGCRFHPRCPFAVDQCRHEIPPLEQVSKDHFAACWRAPL